MEGNHISPARLAPVLLIRLELEAPPRLMLVCGSESEQRRLFDWLDAHPDLLALADRALELADAAQAA